MAPFSTQRTTKVSATSSMKYLRSTSVCSGPARARSVSAAGLPA